MSMKVNKPGAVYTSTGGGPESHPFPDPYPAHTCSKRRQRHREQFGAPNSGPGQDGPATDEPERGPERQDFKVDTSILGIPQQDFTPPVQTAVTELLDKLSTLSGQFDHLSSEYADLQRDSRRDGLTGVLNRPSFFAQIAGCKTAPAGNERHSDALILLSVHDLPELGQRLGHAVSDAVLCGLAHRLERVVVPPDLLGYLENTEFAVFLQGAAKEFAEQRARDICDRFSQEPLQAAGETIMLNLVYGVAALPAEGSLEEALSTADTAMRAMSQTRLSSLKDIPKI